MQLSKPQLEDSTVPRGPIGQRGREGGSLLGATPARLASWATPSLQQRTEGPKSGVGKAPNGRVSEPYSAAHLLPPAEVLTCLTSLTTS